MRYREVAPTQVHIHSHTTTYASALISYPPLTLPITLFTTPTTRLLPWTPLPFSSHLMRNVNVVENPSLTSTRLGYHAAPTILACHDESCFESC